MAERRLTRFDILRRGATATIAVGGVAGFASSASSAASVYRVVGTITELFDRRARIDVPGIGSLEVTLAAAATVSRYAGKDRSDFAEFDLGDRITVAGTPVGTSVEAMTVNIVDRLFTARVLADDGHVVQTTSGPIVLPKNVRSGVLPPLPNAIPAGQPFRAYVRRERNFDIPVAVFAELG